MNVSYSLLGVLLLVFACQKMKEPITNLNGNRVLLLGHGGMGVSDGLPMNSLASIEKCFRMGAEGTEIDVQVSKDGVVFLYHDEDLSSQTEAEGRIGEFDASVLDNVNYSCFPKRHLPLVRLSKLLSLHPPSSHRIYSLDCKPYGDDLTPDGLLRFADALLETMNGISTAYFMVESQHPTLLNYLKAQRPDWRLYFYGNDALSAIQLAEENGFEGISLSNSNLTREHVALAHSKGIWVNTWNIKSQSGSMKAIEKMVDCIQSDAIRASKRALNR